MWCTLKNKVTIQSHFQVAVCEVAVSSSVSNASFPMSGVVQYSTIRYGSPWSSLLFFDPYLGSVMYARKFILSQFISLSLFHWHKEERHSGHSHIASSSSFQMYMRIKQTEEAAQFMLSTHVYATFQQPRKQQ